MRKRKWDSMSQGDLLIWASSPVGTFAEEMLSFPFRHVLDEDKTPLCEIMSKHGSDKGAGWHNYTKLYHYLLNKKRWHVQNVFEVGLGTNFSDVKSSMGELGKPGASLRGWRDYFPSAFIRGADIDRRVLFEDERIRTYYCDQTNPKDIATLWEKLSDIQYELMIDDGLHDFSANKMFLENALHRMVSAGLYVVEDVLVNDKNLTDWQNLLRKLPIQSMIVKIPNRDNQVDNCLVLICGEQNANKEARI